MDKLITVGIPAFKAEKEIVDCLASIQIQTIVDEVSIIIAADNPGDDYDFLKSRFPQLDITILSCEKNVGPGLARQHCLDACKTKWITFIDADDILVNPLSLEYLKAGIENQQTIEVQGIFYQTIIAPNGQTMLMPRNDVTHPWVFGRLYNVNFLKQNNIEFTELRAMEDGEFNWKIRMTIEGTPFKINVVNQPIYMWREGSEHSITRIGRDEKDIPQYNYDLCPLGSTIAAINASKFVKKRNPFNGGVNRFIAELMVGQYFTYIECLEKKKIFAKQNFFNAKRFYNEAYKEIENTISDDILKQIYTSQLAAKAKDLIGIIPEITFFEFMDKVKNDIYGGQEELEQIRSELPNNILENDKKTGVSLW